MGGYWERVRPVGREILHRYQGMQFVKLIELRIHHLRHFYSRTIVTLVFIQPAVTRTFGPVAALYSFKTMEY